MLIPLLGNSLILIILIDLLDIVFFVAELSPHLNLFSFLDSTLSLYQNLQQDKHALNLPIVALLIQAHEQDI